MRLLVPDQLAHDSTPKLSRREREVLQLMARGIVSTTDIADQLEVSTKMVKIWIKRMVLKIGVKSRDEAVEYAIRHNLVRAEPSEQQVPDGEFISQNPSGPRIFISYSRRDAGKHADHLYDYLTKRFGSDQVFMDIKDIGPGADFAEVIEGTVAAAQVVLVLIGRRWMDKINDAQDDHIDFVRREITTAFKRQLHVIPVLVDGAAMPRAADLPEDLKPLTRRHAIQLTDTVGVLMLSA